MPWRWVGPWESLPALVVSALVLPFSRRRAGAGGRRSFPALEIIVVVVRFPAPSLWGSSRRALGSPGGVGLLRPPAK